MDFDLTDDQTAIRTAVAEIAGTFDDHYWMERDREHEFPTAFYDTLASGGWLGVTVPEEYGGHGLRITEASIIMEEIAGAGPREAAMTTEAAISRTALVTGGAQGIGEGIATALGEQGFRVAVVDLDLEAAQATAGAITAAGGVAIAVHADVTDTGSVQDAVKAVTAELGPVEIAVNNAGWDDFMYFVDTTEEFWDRILDVNFKGMLRVTHAVVPGMIERRFGRVVNIGSDAGRVGSSLEAVYSGAKGGTIAFTKTLAREVARYGITANTVCPGPADTAMLRAFAAKSGDGAKVVDGITRGVPMRRLARPSDVAAAVAFFASDATGYITGQTLSVSGGLTMA